MEVEYAFLAEKAVSLGVSFHAQDAGITRLSVLRFPATLPLSSLMLILKCTDADLGREFAIEIACIDAGGKDVIRFGEMVEAEVVKGFVEGQIIMMALSYTIPRAVVFSAPGTYVWHIYVDDQHMKSFDFYVSVGSAGPTISAA